MEPETEQLSVDVASTNQQQEQESRATKARKTRLQNSTPVERRKVARNAANARWSAPKMPAAGRGFPPARGKRGGATSQVFGKALAAAETRLANAIQERAYHTNMTAMLDAEIPSLVQTISALQGAQNPQAPVSPATILTAPAAGRLASTVRLTASPAQGAALGVNLADSEDDDQFLKDSNLAGDNWH